MKLKRILLVVMVLILAIAVMPSCKKKGTEQEETKTEVKKDDKKGELYKVEIGNAAVVGDALSPVTIINFSDFQCPFSKRSFDLMDKFMTDYKGKVRYVFKHFPLGFHQDARPAARAAIAAQKQGKFWEMYKKLFDNQKALNQENLRIYAKELGLDMEKYEKDYADQTTDDQLNDDVKQGNIFGVRGTPTIFINGIRVVGADAAVIDKTIKDQIALGEQVKSAGKNDVYAEIVKDGQTQYIPPKRQAPLIPKDIYKIDLPAGAPMSGSKDAPVTIILFDDFECPFCGRLHATFEDVKKEFGDKLRIVFVNLPLKFHKNAIPMAKASLAAQKQGKFWEMYDKLFTEQPIWKKENDLGAYLEKTAKDLGIDPVKFKKDMDDPKTAEMVDKDSKFAEKIGIRGTPASFVNGRFVGGAYPVESFQAVIKEELERAKPFIEKGLKGDELYNELVKEGKPELVTKRESQEEDPGRVYDVKLSGTEPMKGSKNAAVTIVEFSDHQCPFCKKGAATMRELAMEYRDKVKIYFKHMPLGFHQQAIPAAKYTIAVKKLYGDEKFYKISDMLFENQQEWSAGDMEKAFEKYAKANAMDWANIKKEMETPETDKILKDDMAEASKHGVRGVPGFFVNGKLLSGAQPKERFKMMIDEILKTAKK